MGRQVDEVLLGLGWEEEPIWECLFVRRKQELFLSENVDGQGDGMTPTGGGGLARVPNLLVWNHLVAGWHTHRGKGE